MSPKSFVWCQGLTEIFIADKDSVKYLDPRVVTKYAEVKCNKGRNNELFLCK